MLDPRLRIDAAGALMFVGWAEIAAGDLARAASAMRAPATSARGTRETGYFSSAAGWLSVALARMGDLDEADRYAQLSWEAARRRRLVLPDRLAGWQSQVLTRRGELEKAEHLAREAVDMGRRTEYLFDTGLALSVLAEVLLQAERTDEAITALEKALSLFVRKGDVVDTARVRETLAWLRG